MSPAPPLLMYNHVLSRQEELCFKLESSSKYVELYLLNNIEKNCSAEESIIIWSPFFKYLTYNEL